MPALMPTGFSAEVIWLGTVFSAELPTLMSETSDALDLTFEGVAGARHFGHTRPSCVRVTSQYPRGTAIRNERQLSILSQEELDEIAKTMGIEKVDPARLGASMVVKGIPDFSHVPPSSRLLAASGASVVIDMENRPCVIPARSLEAVHPGQGKGFKPAAEGRRGVTASVASEGRVAVGDRLTLHIPDQPLWAHLSEAPGM